MWKFVRIEHPSTNLVVFVQNTTIARSMILMMNKYWWIFHTVSTSLELSKSFTIETKILIEYLKECP